MDHNIHRKALPYDQGSEEKDVDKSVDKNVWDAPPPYELHLEGSVLTSSAAITGKPPLASSTRMRHALTVLKTLEPSTLASRPSTPTS